MAAAAGAAIFDCRLFMRWLLLIRAPCRYMLRCHMLRDVRHVECVRFTLPMLRCYAICFSPFSRRALRADKYYAASMIYYCFDAS